MFLFFIRVLNTASHSVYMAQHKHQRKLSGSVGYFAFPLMKCSNTRQAANISLQSKQSPKKEIFMMKEPQTSSVLVKMSNCRHRVNYFCSQPWGMAEFLHQNYSTTEKFWQIKYFLLNKVMNRTKDERHQKRPLLNWILYGPNRLNLSGRLWETRRQHSQIQTTFPFPPNQEKSSRELSLFFFPLRNLVICTKWKKYAKYSTTYPLIDSLAEVTVRAMGSNSTASTWFLNPPRTRWSGLPAVSGEIKDGWTQEN